MMSRHAALQPAKRMLLLYLGTGYAAKASVDLSSNRVRTALSNLHKERKGKIPSLHGRLLGQLCQVSTRLGADDAIKASRSSNTQFYESILKPVISCNMLVANGCMDYVLLVYPSNMYPASLGYC